MSTPRFKRSCTPSMSPREALSLRRSSNIRSILQCLYHTHRVMVRHIFAMMLHSSDTFEFEDGVAQIREIPRRRLEKRAPPCGAAEIRLLIGPLSPRSHKADRGSRMRIRSRAQRLVAVTRSFIIICFPHTVASVNIHTPASCLRQCRLIAEKKSLPKHRFILIVDNYAGVNFAIA